MEIENITPGIERQEATARVDKEDFTFDTYAIEFGGCRSELMKEMKIPWGWVIDGDFPEEFWDKDKIFFIPIRPRKFPLAINARWELNQLYSRYEEEVSFVIIPDDETDIGWSFLPVINSDLERNGPELLDESHQEMRRRDYVLSRMKRCAAIIVLGGLETK